MTKMKYFVEIRGVLKKRNHNFEIEANDIQEAAQKVRDKFPHHLGYTIKPAN